MKKSELRQIIKEEIQNILESKLKLKFEKDHGYWDVTKYPYGGNFKRFKGAKQEN